MRTLFILFLIGSLSGCATTRSTNNVKEKIHLMDRGTIERTAPGDRVYITVPAVPKDRPKAVTETYTGENGAFTDVDYDKDGQITNIRSNCPEVSEMEQKNLELDYSFREKDSQREFNIEIAKIGRSTILILGGIFAVAWVVKGLIKP